VLKFSLSNISVHLLMSPDEETYLKKHYSLMIHTVTTKTKFSFIAAISGYSCIKIHAIFTLKSDLIDQL